MVSKVNGIEVPVITKLDGYDEVKKSLNDVKNYVTYLAGNFKSSFSEVNKQFSSFSLSLKEVNSHLSKFEKSYKLTSINVGNGIRFIINEQNKFNKSVLESVSSLGKLTQKAEEYKRKQKELNDVFNSPSSKYRNLSNTAKNKISKDYEKGLAYRSAFASDEYNDYIAKHENAKIQESLGLYNQYIKEQETLNAKKIEYGKIDKENNYRSNEFYKNWAIQNKEQLDAYDKATKELGKFGNDGTKSVNKLSDSFKDLTLRMRSLSYYYVGSAIIRSVMDMVGSLSSLQASFANIQAIVAASDTQMTKLQKTIFDVASSTRYTTEEISEATTILGQAGLTVEQIQGTLMQTAVLASATGTSVAETAANMTSVLAVWNMTADQSTRIADTFVTAINSSKATMQTMSQAIQYAGVQLADMGVSFEEVTAAAAGTANAGMKVRSMIGTGMRSLVTELQAPTKKVIEGLEKYGLTVEDVSIETYGLIGVMKKLKDAGIDGSNAFEFLNKRSATFLVAASSQLDTMERLRKSFADEGAATRANETQMNTLNAQMIVFTQTLQKLLYETFEPFMKALTSFLKVINGVFDSLNTSFGKIITQMAIAAVSFGQLFKFIGKLTVFKTLFETFKNVDKVSTFSGAVNGVKSLTKVSISLRNVWFTIKALMGGVKGIIAGIVTIGAYHLFDEFKSSAEQLEEVSGKTQEYSERVNSVESAIEELNKKQNLYTEDGNALNLRIMELNKQFKEQGLELIKLGEDYDVVLKKMTEFQALEMRNTADSKLKEADLLKENFTQSGLFSRMFNIDNTMDAEFWAQKAYKNLKSGTVNEIDLRNSISESNLSDEVKKVYINALNNVVDAYNKELEATDLNLQANLTEVEGGDVDVVISGLDALSSDLEKRLTLQYKSGEKDSNKIKAEIEKTKNDRIELVIETLESLYETAGVSYGDLLKELKQATIDGNAEAVSKLWTQIQSDLGGAKEVSKLKIGLSSAIASLDGMILDIIDVQIEELKKQLKEVSNEKNRKDIETKIDNLTTEKNKIETFKDIADNLKNTNRNNRPVREKRDPFLTSMKSRIALIESDSKIGKAITEGGRSKLDDNSASSSQIHFYEELTEYSNKLYELNALTEKKLELEKLEESSYGEWIKRYKEAQSVEEKQKILNNLEKRGDLGRNALEAINMYNSLSGDVESGYTRYGKDLVGAKRSILEDAEFAAKMKTWGDSENIFAKGFSGIMGSEGMIKIDNDIKKYVKDWTSLFTDLGETIGNSMQSGMTDAANAIWNGEKSVGEAFADMGKQILQSLGQFITQVLVQAAVIAALNAIPGMTALLTSMDASAYLQKMTMFSSIANAFSALGGNATGDVTSKKAGGGLIGGGVPNRDSVHAMLMPGEYVMKKSAVDALGTDFLSDLNNNATQTMDNAYEKMDKSNEEKGTKDTTIEPSVTNVWVVADRDQAKMGPQDVIATISRDILTGGQTKRLIQSVVAGRK